VEDQGLRFFQTPWQMAQRSDRVARARDFVLSTVLSISDEHLRATVGAMLMAAGCQDARLEQSTHSTLAASRALLLSDPVASVPHTAAQQTSLAKLAASLPYDPTWAAPGAALSSHHCYPGGWALHTALNLQAALHLREQAQRIKGAECDRDALVAAIILHDWAKLKLLTWDAEHDLDSDQGVGHHVIVLVECILRDLAPRVIRLLAGVHGGWWLRPEEVWRSIERAAQWVSVDPVARGYLDPQRDGLSIETWIARQAEVSWYEATKQGVQALEELLVQWHAQAELPFGYTRWRHALYASFDELQLIQELARGGAAQLELRLREWTAGRMGGM
jgi:hypothetical protein